MNQAGRALRLTKLGRSEESRVKAYLNADEPDKLPDHCPETKTVGRMPCAKLLVDGPCDRAYTDHVEEPIPADWLEDFEAAARRPLPLRWRYAFIKTYKPVMDDAEYRSFDTMEDYRRWCEINIPDWLGYARIRISAS
jgi:hypothetical protein